MLSYDCCHHRTPAATVSSHRCITLVSNLNAHLGELNRTALTLATAPIPLSAWPSFILFVFSSSFASFPSFSSSSPSQSSQPFSLLAPALPSRLLSAVACAQTLDGRNVSARSFPPPPPPHSPPKEQGLLYNLTLPACCYK